MVWALATQTACRLLFPVGALITHSLDVCRLLTSSNHCRHRGGKTFSACFSASALSDQAVESPRHCQKCILKRSGKIFLTLDVLMHFSEQSITWVEHISTLFSIRLGNQKRKIPWCTIAFLCLFTALFYIIFGVIWTIYCLCLFEAQVTTTIPDLVSIQMIYCNITKLQI